MADKCGGDWWGYLEVPRQNAPPLLLLVIGDVDGHGIGPALVAAVGYGGLGGFAHRAGLGNAEKIQAALILDCLNHVVYESTQGTMTMTVFAAVIDPGAGTISCVNGGHNKPYLISPESTGSDTYAVQAVGKAGLLLGSQVGGDFSKSEVYPWTPDSKLILYTDGLLHGGEGQARPKFGRKALTTVLSRNGRGAGEELMKKILQDRKSVRGTGTEEDDITLIVVEQSK